MNIKLPTPSPFFYVLLGLGLLFVIFYVETLNLKVGLQNMKQNDVIVEMLIPKEEVKPVATESAEVVEAEPSPTPKSNAKRVVSSPLPQGE